jgi:hypothetical protein
VSETDLVFLNVSETPAHVRIRMRAENYECCDNSEGFVDVPARGSLHVPIGFNDPGRTIAVLSTGAITIDRLPNSSGATVSIIVERTNYWSVDGIARAGASSVMGNQVR